jgi:hypothetical protein
MPWTIIFNFCQGNFGLMFPHDENIIFSLATNQSLLPLPSLLPFSLLPFAIILLFSASHFPLVFSLFPLVPTFPPVFLLALDLIFPPMVADDPDLGGYFFTNKYYFITVNLSFWVKDFLVRLFAPFSTDLKSASNFLCFWYPVIVKI